MELIKEFYENMTAEQLEEYVEFVDWTLVIERLITDKIKSKFSSLPLLRARMWFKEILNSLKIKFDEEKYPSEYFFFIGDKFFMDYNKKTKYLWCSHKLIWLVFESEYKLNYNEIQSFIKSMVEQHFKNMVVTPHLVLLLNVQAVEQHFKNMVVTPKAMLNPAARGVEQHFSNKKQ